MTKSVVSTGLLAILPDVACPHQVLLQTQNGSISALGAIMDELSEIVDFGYEEYLKIKNI
ncbi:MAG: hypothetical protein QME85_04085 [Candidatus Saccharicenans sp.]|nr:hypothetical protein [Candidatus Saccharicenans sp.]MDI6811186.1 hypothetical protein [archaeon]